MRSLLLGFTAAALGLAGALSASAASAMPVSPAYSWTGCYVGGNAGAAWSHTDVVDEVDASVQIATLNAAAAAGGGQIGCDYQFTPQWVVGLQGMWDATGLKAETTGGLLDDYVLHGAIPWVATATARLGFVPAPNFMIYARGGAAWNHTDTSLTDGGSPVGDAAFDQTGWTAGIGTEWQMGHWSIFTEYNYLGFTPQVVNVGGSDLGSVKTNVQLLLVGVNLRFGAP